MNSATERSENGKDNSGVGEAVSTVVNQTSGGGHAVAVSEWYFR